MTRTMLYAVLVTSLAIRGWFAVFDHDLPRFGRWADNWRRRRNKKPCPNCRDAAAMHGCCSTCGIGIVLIRESVVGDTGDAR
jgi:hypothetical protein